MNLNQLISKLKAIDEGEVTSAPPVAPEHTDKPAEAEGIIIGGPVPPMMGGMGMMGHEEAPKQPDNVTMNVSINGSGAGGVKDLMNILRDIENGPASHVGQVHDNEPLFGGPKGHEENVGEMFDDDKETWGNSAHGDAGHHTHGVDAVTASGDDMNRSKPAHKHSYRNADNPMAMESLVDRLSSMYQAIKEERTEEKDEKGNVVKWKEETPWRKAQDKDGRGKVTNMSDKARRESEKLAKKELKENATHVPIGQQMANDGITYSGAKEKELIGLMAEYMQKDGMSPKTIRYLLSYDEDFIPDQLSYLPREHEHHHSHAHNMGESQLYENDLEKALDSTAGGFTGWNHMQGKSYENYGPYKHHVRTAVKNGADVYHYDDGEGGYDATGEVVYDKNNGIYYAVINKEPSTHKSLGSLMNLIRNEIGENGRRHDANNQHRSDSLDREPFDPEQHLYKTDRAGKKGMLNKGRINDLTSPYRRKITGPQSVLPEQMNESKELNDIIALTKYLKG